MSRIKEMKRGLGLYPDSPISQKGLKILIERARRKAIKHASGKGEPAPQANVVIPSMSK